MKLTDRKAIQIYNKLKCPELWESIDTYPEDERDGRNDLQLLADEISYFKSMFEEYGTIFFESLEESKEILRETKQGKVIPLNSNTLKPKYSQYDLEVAKNIVSEYRQLKYYENKIQNDDNYYGGR